MLEDFVDWKMSFENEVPAIFDLVEGIFAAEVDGLPVLVGKLRSQEPSPVVQALLNDFGVQFVGCGL